MVRTGGKGGMGGMGGMGGKVDEYSAESGLSVAFSVLWFAAMSGAETVPQ